MNKILLTGTIIATVTVFATILATGEFVEAAKPISEIPKQISLTPIGSVDGNIKISGEYSPSTNLLFYGTTLCKIDIGTSTLNHFYIEFATTTTVQDSNIGGCGVGRAIGLVGSSDAVFNQGDILVLDFQSGSGLYEEVHREQTI